MCAVWASESIGDPDPFRILSWLRATFVDSEDRKPLSGQALYRSAELVRWYVEKGWVHDPRSLSTMVYDVLREFNHATPGIVRYILESGLFSTTTPHLFTQYVIRAACRRDQEELVMLLLAHSVCDSFRHEFTYAPLRPGGPKVLTWSPEFEMRRYGVDNPNVARITWLAFLGGNAEMVEWLVREHGVRNVQIPDDLSNPEGECLAIIKVLHAADALYASVQMMDWVTELGYLQVVQFLHENRTEGCTMATMNYAAMNGHLQVVQWLHENRTEGCSRAALNSAAKNGHLEVVRWLVENRPADCDVNEAMLRAAANGNLDELIWLAEHRPGACISCITRMVLTRTHSYVDLWSNEIDPHVLYTLMWLDEQQRAMATQCKGECVKRVDYHHDVHLAIKAVAHGNRLLLEYLDTTRHDEWPPFQRESGVPYLRAKALPGLRWVLANRPDWINGGGCVLADDAPYAMGDAEVREWVRTMVQGA